MTTKQSVDQWSDGYRLAWENADADAAASLFAEDCTYRDLIYDTPHQGRDGVGSYWSSVTAGQSDVSVRMGSPAVDGHNAMVEFWATMAVDGAPVTLAGCLLLEFDDDGLCSALREYWNFAEGTHQPPPGWGT